MDELQDYEIELLVGNIGWSYKQEWEMTRLNSYCSLSAFGKPKKSMTKMFPLPTDHDYSNLEKASKTITKKDLSKIQENKNKILNYINGSKDRNTSNI